LEDKRRRDQARAGFGSAFWLIHGTCYDLTAFAERHPGGRTWIDLTRGTDATQAFETHHIDIDKARRLLAKYAVPAAAPLHPEATKAYSWDPQAFYATVRQRAHALLASQPDVSTGPTRYMLFLSYAALALWVLAFLNLCHSGSLVAAGVSGQRSAGEGGGPLHPLPSFTPHRMARILAALPDGCWPQLLSPARQPVATLCL
jgi:hypothetical protein